MRAVRVVADIVLGSLGIWCLWVAERLYQTLYGRWRTKARTEREGVVLYVSRGFRHIEAGRVGFDREASANPATDFDEQIGVVMARARQRASSLNAVERNWRRR